MSSNRKLLGRRGEELARRYFQKNGFIVVDHNFRLRWGEIDLVLRKDKAFRFVEVKFRRNIDYGLPEEAVVKNKQKRIKNVALYWLKRRHLPLDTEVHFDILAITEGQNGIEYNYLEDAF